MHWFKSLTAVAVLSAGVAFASPAANAADPVTIRIAYAVAVTNLGSLMSLKPELLTHNGKSYNFEPVFYKSSTDEITGLATGDLEIANLAYTSLPLAITNAGLTDLRIIGDEFQDGVPGYYSAQYFVRKDSGINAPADLSGKIVASPGAGTAYDLSLRAELKKSGLEDKKNVTFLEAGMANMKALLLDKKVDLITAALPFSRDPGLLEVAKPLFSSNDAVGPTQSLVFVSRQGFIAQNRAALVDFLEDALRVRQWFLDPANRTEAIALAAQATKQAPDAINGWLFNNNDYYRDPNGTPNLDALQANIDMQKDQGFLPQSVAVKDYADLSMVQEAAARLK